VREGPRGHEDALSRSAVVAFEQNAEEVARIEDHPDQELATSLEAPRAKTIGISWGSNENPFVGPGSIRAA